MNRPKFPVNPPLSGLGKSEVASSGHPCAKDMMRLIRVVLSSLGDVASFRATNIRTIHGEDGSYFGGPFFLKVSWGRRLIDQPET